MSGSLSLRSSLAALAAAILFIQLASLGSCSVVDPLKRARASASSSSSLIPFPRVGRSVNSHAHLGDADSSLYFGQKRTGKSSLIPFPRVGRGGAAAWDLEADSLGDLDHLLDAASSKKMRDMDSDFDSYSSVVPLLRVLLQRAQEQELDHYRHAY